MRFRLVGVLLFVAVVAAAETRVERAEAVKQDATVTISHSVAVACSPEIVTALLDRPELAAALWSAFGMTPAYVVSGGEAGAFHLTDPTGITADVWHLARFGASRSYLADGQFDHWAVKGLSKATAVVEVGVAGSSEGQATIELLISVKADAWVADIALSALAPAIDTRAKARIVANLKDAKRIVEAIARSPRAVAGKLKGDTKREFVALFVPPPEPPAAKEPAP